jgi:hypothetical protein
MLNLFLEILYHLLMKILYNNLLNLRLNVQMTMQEHRKYMDVQCNTRTEKIFKRALPLMELLEAAMQTCWIHQDVIRKAK